MNEFKIGIIDILKSFDNLNDECLHAILDTPVTTTINNSSSNSNSKNSDSDNNTVGVGVVSFKDWILSSYKSYGALILTADDQKINKTDWCFFFNKSKNNTVSILYTI